MFTVPEWQEGCLNPLLVFEFSGNVREWNTFFRIYTTFLSVSLSPYLCRCVSGPFSVFSLFLFSFSICFCTLFNFSLFFLVYVTPYSLLCRSLSLLLYVFSFCLFSVYLFFFFFMYVHVYIFIYSLSLFVPLFLSLYLISLSLFPSGVGTRRSDTIGRVTSIRDCTKTSLHFYLSLCVYLSIPRPLSSWVTDDKKVVYEMYIAFLPFSRFSYVFAL